MEKFLIDPYESDGHLRWEIDLAALKAVRLIETFDDNWVATTYDIRRADGTWQYFETEEMRKRRTESLADEATRIEKNFAGVQLEGSIKDAVNEARAAVSRNLAEARAVASSWIDLPNDVSREIERRWKAQMGGM